MIYQPKNIQPTFKSVDGNNNNEISMVMNTTGYVDAYQLTIYNMDNTVFYNGVKTNFSDNLYNGDTGYIQLPSSLNLVNGTDYKWTAKLYQNGSDMLVTYGNIISPGTYTYKVPSGGMTSGNYHFIVGNNTYIYTTTKNLVQNDLVSFDSQSEVFKLIVASDTSYYFLPTTKISNSTFGTITLTSNTYTVGSDGLQAGKYHFVASGVDYWFDTLSNLKSGDTIVFDPVAKTITQNYSSIAISLNYVSSTFVSSTLSVNTTTNVYLQQNVNIKSQMSLKVNNETKTISSYDVATGLAVLSSALSAVPSAGDEYSVVSDFIETNPESLLHVRTTPVVSVVNAPALLTSKNASFEGSYTQAEDVPLVYYVWNLYSVRNDTETLIETSGKTFSAKIGFSYDGFKNEETYAIELICENEFGIIANAKYIFSVRYDEVIYDEQPVAAQTSEQGIRVSWLTTVSTEPYSVSVDNVKGTIQSDDNTEDSLWLLPGQDIYPDTTIIVGLTASEGIINSYNTNTGYTTLKEPLNYVPTLGESYYIYSRPNYDLNGIGLEQNVPYSGVNSAVLGNNHLIYSKTTGISEYPESYQLTMQFLLDKNFFYGDNNVYQDMALIARYEGSSPLGDEDLMIFAKDYNFCAIKPSVENNSVVGGTVTSVEADGSAMAINLIGTFVPGRHKFLCLVSQEYIACIASYDSDTNTITFEKNIPEEYIPSVGDTFFLYDTVTEAYYKSPNNVFCLQAGRFASPYSDYVWADSDTWDDTRYWIEGGTPVERATDTWWKLQITDSTIIVEKGGV